MKRIIEIEEKDLERIREIVERENKTYLSVTTRGTAYITIADSKPYDEIINSAPTVEMPKHSLLPLAGDCDEAYMRGYKHGKAEGILKAHTRPKGKWIGECYDPECDQCHTKPLEEFFDSLGLDGGSYVSIPMLFCPNCGADMRKGGAE